MENITLELVENLLFKNKFERVNYPYAAKAGDWCGKLREDYEISYGHSEIRTYKRSAEIVHVQYQEDEIMSFIFDELPLQHESNSVSPKTSLRGYAYFESLEDIKTLFKFAKGIKIDI